MKMQTFFCSRWCYSPSSCLTALLEKFLLNPKNFHGREGEDPSYSTEARKCFLSSEFNSCLCHVGLSVPGILK